MKSNDNNNSQFCALRSAPTPEPGGLFNFQTGNIWFENRAEEVKYLLSKVTLYRPARTIRLAWAGLADGQISPMNELN